MTMYQREMQPHGGTARTPHLIILNNEPRMLREMLQHALEQIPGFIVVHQEAQLNGLLQQVQIDWLVVTLGKNAEVPRDAYLWMRRTPTLSLLALAPDGELAEVRLKYADRVLKFSFSELTLSTLVAILQYKWDDLQLPSVLCRLSPVQQSAHHSVGPVAK
jgi:hypothetical protein